MKTSLKLFCSFALIGWFSLSTFAEVSHDIFIPGEVSEYKITWMRIPLAWSRSETDTIEEDGRKLIRLRIISKTYSTYTYIYKVNDVVEVIIDPESGLPIRQDIVVREGGRNKSQLTIFDHKNRVATYIDRIASTTNTVAIDSDTQEVYSYIYSIRKRDINKLAANKHKIFVDGELHDFGIKIGKDAQIKLPTYGKVDSTAIEPVAAFNGLFLREGKITFWISKKNRRMITCIKAKVPIGKITVKLQSVAGPGEDFWVNTEE
ncbi:MAG: DUF3108 domain-containing protein [Pontiella sp.]